MNAEKKKKRPREKFKPLPWLIVLGVILALVIGSYVAWKIEDYRENQRDQREVYVFEYVDGKYYDKENEITYVAAPHCYTYVLKSAEEYAKSASNEDYKLFYIGYKTTDSKGKEQTHMTSPKSMLGSSFESGAMLYYNPEKVTIPEPSDFSYDITNVCDNKGMLIATHELDRVQTKNLLEEYFSNEENLYKDGTEFAMLTSLKELRITSDTHKALHLVMYLYTDNSGHYYLYSSYERKLTLVGDANAAVFDAMFADSKEEGA